jgi:NADH dehydrogenase
MRILVTGGTGVVGTSTVTALLKHGHGVRLLSRHADRDAEAWTGRVEPWVGNVADAESVRGAAEACDAVIHLVAIVDEAPPATFQSVNVDGTRHMLAEASRAGVGRFIHMSSLGADRGTSPYHHSKKESEDLVRGFTGKWLILRPGAVYGPGDEHLSVLLRMIRTLPVVPLVGGGDQQFQPLWHEDLAEALAIAVERDDLNQRVIDIAGTEITTQKELTERMRELTGRSIMTLPVPEFAAHWGIKALDFVGIGGPVGDSQLQMLSEGSVIPADRENGLVTTFGIEPTPLAVGIRRFLDEQPENLPSDGVGPLRRKRFWADIAKPTLDGDQLFAHLRSNLSDMMPAIITTDPEPGTRSIVVEGETLTLALPLRGNIQVRVAEAADRTITLLTVQGHPLAGAVRFMVTTIDDGVRFEIQIYDRASSVVDLVVMRTIGELVQDATWRQMVQTVARVAGGGDITVREESDNVEGHDAEVIERWAEELAMRLRREAHGAEMREPPRDATAP